MDKQAKKEGVKPAAVVRRALRAYVEGYCVADVSSLVEAVDRLRADLSRVGGNLNQVAYAFNTDNGLDRGALAVIHDELRLQFREVAHVLKEVRQELLAKAR